MEREDGDDNENRRGDRRAPRVPPGRGQCHGRAGFTDLLAADGVLNAGQESYRGEQKRVSLCQPQ